MTRLGALAGGTAAVCLGFVLVAGPAAAGPCTAKIAELEKQMSSPSGKEAGTMAGNAPGAIQEKAPAPQTGTPNGAAEPAGSTAMKGKSVGTTMAGNAPNSMGKPVDPANGRATSPQDVRLQTAGEPTTAQGGNPKALDTHMSQAKAALDKAKSLDAKNDASCGSAVDQARDLMRKGK
jgi:hypothetical protein